MSSSFPVLCRMLHRAPISRWLNSAFRIPERPTRIGLPVFLCPSARYAAVHGRSAASVTSPSRTRNPQHQWRARQTCSFHTQADKPYVPEIPPFTTREEAESAALQKLPRQCTGCGAMSQYSLPNNPGYYDLNRKAVRKYLGIEKQRERPGSAREEDEVVRSALESIDVEKLKESGVELGFFDLDDSTDQHNDGMQPPIRCTMLLNMAC